MNGKVDDAEYLELLHDPSRLSQSFGYYHNKTNDSLRSLMGLMVMLRPQLFLNSTDSLIPIKGRTLTLYQITLSIENNQNLDGPLFWNYAYSKMDSEHYYYFNRDFIHFINQFTALWHQEFPKGLKVESTDQVFNFDYKPISPSLVTIDICPSKALKEPHLKQISDAVIKKLVNKTSYTLYIS
ncbi:MAG: hypothetical protein OXC92_00680 [Flavobacteriaceae bacterium]|nr:hypothetical protein [Flavobacteriaceae bacterium]